MFMLIFIVIMLGLSYVVERVALGGDDRVRSRNKNIVRIQNEKANTIDALFVGDSETFCSFSPMEMWKNEGLTSFVCAQSAQRIQETYYMLKTAFKNQSPKVVVLETNTIFAERSRLDGVRQAIVEVGRYYLPLVCYHNIWKYITLGITYPEESYKGFVIYDAVNSYDGEEYMTETKEKERISPIAKFYLNQILDLCKKHKARVCLVSAPAPKYYSYRKHNALSTYANKRGVDYVDLNVKVKELRIDWKTDSLDYGEHLNYAGARKVSSYMGKYLKQAYDLPDHREDESYQEWKKDLEKYQDRVDVK